jgi:hypothetical protein
MRLMDPTPNTSTTRTRTKAVATDAPAAKSGRKTLTTKKKSASTSDAAAPPQSAVENTSDIAAPVDMHALIERAAFFMAAERGFAPGHELDDWLEAERRVRAQSSA